MASSPFRQSTSPCRDKITESALAWSEVGRPLLCGHWIPIAFRSAKRVTVADRESGHPLTTPLETIVCELARRRLRKLAIEEKP